MRSISNLKIKIFADGADKAGMLEMNKKSFISGFTTNPTLMKVAGVTDYEAFAKDILKLIPDKPLSLEVFSDDFSEMKRQALKLNALGSNVYVKIPVTNTKREPSFGLIRELSEQGVKLNVTALMTLEQVRETTYAMEKASSGIISVFAGRIADTGVDPIPFMQASLEIMKLNSNLELIWASPRELLNIFQADSIGCHIITVTNDVLKKLSNVGKDLGDFSLDTVKMFYNDAVNAGFKL
jgi:transaldolase